MSLHNGLFRPTFLESKDNNNSQQTTIMRSHALSCRSTDDRFMSKSYGGDYSPLRNMLHRQASSEQVSRISYSGYLLKRSNQPCQPRQQTTTRSPPTINLFQEDGGDGVRMQGQGSHTTTPTTPPFPLIDSADLVDAPGLPFTTMSPPRSTLTARSNNNHLHSTAPTSYDNNNTLPWRTGLDAPATTDYRYDGEFGPLHQRPSTAASPTTTPLNDALGTTSEPILDDEVDDNQDDSVAMNPLEQGLQMCAAFFGIQLPDSKPISSASSGSLSSSTSSTIMKPHNSESYGGSTAVPYTTAIPPPSAKKRSAPIKVGSPSAVSKSLPVKGAATAIPVAESSSSSAEGSSSALSSQQDQHSELYQHHRQNVVPSFTYSGRGSFLEAQQYRRQSTGDEQPPLDFVDPIDGHLWRAKYCVLEDGVLYFYRNPTDAESPEAIAERRQAVPLWKDGENKQSIDEGNGVGEVNADTRNKNDITDDNNRNTQIRPNRAPLTVQTSSGTATTSGSSSSTLMKSNIADLSKSPMVRRRTYKAQLSSSSESYASYCSGAMWEKRVFLNCVGAVRSAELDYGTNSFELVAIHDDDDEKSNPSHHGEDDNNVDDDGSKSSDTGAHKLVLQARNVDEMNEWLFQFHRSLASFLMNLMDVVGSTSRSAYLDIDHPSSFHRRPQDGIANTLEYRQRQQKYPTHSPRPQPSAGTYNVPLASSLSHGHGRNALHRRRINSGDGTGSHYRQKSFGDNETSSLSSTPDTAGGSSIGGGSTHLPFSFVPSPVGNFRFSPSRNSPNEQQIQGALLLPPSHQQQQNKQKASAMEELAPEYSVPQSQDPETERPLPTKTSGKYIPPHLRAKQQEEGDKGAAAPKRYVPPHLRKKQQQENETKVSDAPKRYVPPSMRKNHGNNADKTHSSGGSGGPSLLSLAERAEAAPETTVVGSPEDNTTSSMSAPVSQLDHLDVLDEHDEAFKRGGCADPQLALGSILDDAFIPKKASKVGPAPSEAFGCYGGGDVSEESSNLGENSMNDAAVANANQRSSNLRWEVGAVSECGIRNSNEDAYLIAGDLIKAFQSLSEPEDNDSDTVPVPSSWSQSHDDEVDHDLGLFAVFDGHCGDQAARFATERLAHFIHEESKLQGAQPVPHGDDDDNTLPGRTTENHPLHPSSIERVLGEAVAKLDTEFCGLCVEGGREWESGATALVAMVAKEHLVVANLGDCRGVVCRFVEHDYTVSVESLDDAKYDSGMWNELDSKLDWHAQNRDSDTIDAPRGRCMWKEVTEIHSPGRDDERKRIELANGWVTTETEIPMGLQLRRMDFLDADVIEILKRCFNGRYDDSSNRCNSAAPQRILHINRVCGELSVSRALGDRDFKAAFNSANGNGNGNNILSAPPATGLLDHAMNVSGHARNGEDGWWDSTLFLPYPDNHNQKFQGDLVSNTPDFYRVKIGEKGVLDEFLLLACDGLWDVMDADDAVRITRDLLFRKKWKAKKAAARLAELAIHLGSSDNVTVIVVRFFLQTT